MRNGAVAECWDVPEPIDQVITEARHAWESGQKESPEILALLSRVETYCYRLMRAATQMGEDREDVRATLHCAVLECLANGPYQGNCAEATMFFGHVRSRLIPSARKSMRHASQRTYKDIDEDDLEGSAQIFPSEHLQELRLRRLKGWLSERNPEVYDWFLRRAAENSIEDLRKELGLSRRAAKALEESMRRLIREGMDLLNAQDTQEGA